MQEGPAEEAAALDADPPLPPLDCRARLRAAARKCGPWLLNFCTTHWLPLNFLIAVIIALTAPVPGRAVVSVTILNNIHLVQTINIFIVFLISGLVLNTADIKKALSYWHGITWGFASILFLTALLGLALRTIPLSPPEFATGLAIFACVPTTLGVGEALVRASKGNAALALLLLVGTNAMGVATMGPVLKLVLSGQTELEGGASVDALALFVKLCVTVLAPAVVGKVLRDLAPLVRRFATRRKKQLGMFATSNLAVIIWQTMSGAQEVIVHQPFVNILYVILLATAQHCTYLLFNFSALLLLLRIPLREAIAVGIMASQKSAPVAVTVISYLSTDVTTQGLLAVPCITGQLVQIFMGAGFAPFLARLVDRKGPVWLPFPGYHPWAWVPCCRSRAAAAAAAAAAEQAAAGAEAAAGDAAGAAAAAAQDGGKLKRGEEKGSWKEDLSSSDSAAGAWGPPPPSDESRAAAAPSPPAPELV